eukprot:g6165.t1
MADGDSEHNIDGDLKALYRYMRSLENKLGGGEGFEGVYGSLTMTGMNEVIKSMQRNCKLTNNSSLVDVGSGLGRPLLHASLSPGISKLWGIEMDSVKVQKSLTFLRQVRQSMVSAGKWPQEISDPPKLTHAPIENIESLDSYTHAYSFWEGVPVQAKRAFGELFTTSESMIGLTVVQRAFRRSPESEMEKLGFCGLTLMQSIRVRMSGSGQTFTAYVFYRAKLPAAHPALSSPSTPRQDTVYHRYSEQAQRSGEMSVLRKSMVNMALTEPPPSRDRKD